MAFLRPDFMLRPLRFWEVEPESWQQVMDVNVRGPFLLARHVVRPLMRHLGSRHALPVAEIRAGRLGGRRRLWLLRRLTLRRDGRQVRQRGVGGVACFEKLFSHVLAIQPDLGESFIWIG